MENIPKNLEQHWAAISEHEFPGIPIHDHEFFAQALQGLLTYFALCCAASSSSKQTALPSNAADSVWHAWLDMDSPSLDEFCLTNFGQSIAHVESNKFELGQSLAETFVLNCNMERKPLDEVPSLFALDLKLKMPFGFAYEQSRSDGGVQFCVLDAHGNKPNNQPSKPHPMLTPWAMYKLGYTQNKPLCKPEEVEYLELEILGAGCGGKCGGNCGGKCGGVLV